MNKRVIPSAIFLFLYSLNVLATLCGNEGCGKEDTPVAPFQSCAQCHRISYCSKECQKAHWRAGHKGKCQKEPAAAVAKPASKLEKMLFENNLPPKKQGEEHSRKQKVKQAQDTLKQFQTISMKKENEDKETLSKLSAEMNRNAAIIVKLELCSCYFVACFDAMSQYEKSERKEELENVLQLVVDKNLNVKNNHLINDPDVDISIPIKESAYFLAKTLFKGSQKGQEEEARISSFLKIAMDLGHEDAAALFYFRAFTENLDHPDEQAIRGMEEHINSREWSSRIKAMLALFCYIKNNHKKAWAIFAELKELDSDSMRFLGLMGEISLLAQQDDQDDNDVAELQEKLSGIIQEFPVECKTMQALPVLWKYELATHLVRYGNLVQILVGYALLNKVSKMGFYPAGYFIEENAAKKPEALQLEGPEEKPVVHPQVKEAVAQQDPTPIPEDPEEKEVFTPKAPPKARAVPARQKVLPAVIADLQNPKFDFVLSNQALSDLGKMLRKHKGELPFDANLITDIAERIKRGEKSPELGTKIRGTKDFWRSWVGRDYRMDWRFIINDSGARKIEIRHIGPKKNFTYLAF